MPDPAPDVIVDFRIPGVWSHPRELLEQMPEGYRLTPDALILPDKTKIGLDMLQPDDRFAQIFRSSLRQPATDEELAKVDDYQVNIILSGPGGSLDAARTMMEAASAIIKAGGAGVFIDNSGVSHGGDDWLIMADDGTPDALSFAFVGIIRGRHEVWTMGMHVLGLREIVMKRSDIEIEGYDIIEVIRYLSRGEKPMDDGHIIADDEGTPQFQARFEESPPDTLATAMHNPFGRIRLVSMRDFAEEN